MGINGQWEPGRGRDSKRGAASTRIVSSERARPPWRCAVKCPMCPPQPVKLRITPANDAPAPHGSNRSCLCRISCFDAWCFSIAKPVASIAQLCVARAERSEGLKPFVACRDLIIVIPLCTWERKRVMTISHETAIDLRMRFSGDAGTVSGGLEERGGVCG